MFKKNHVAQLHIIPPAHWSVEKLMGSSQLHMLRGEWKRETPCSLSQPLGLGAVACPGGGLCAVSLCVLRCEVVR